MRRGFVKAMMTALLSACGGQLPPPQVISITPNQMSSSGTANATAIVDAILPTVVDYGRGQVTVERSLLLTIGTLTVGESRFENNGVLTAFVPSKLLPGVYDVTITLVDLRAGTLARGFTVTPGQWPNGYTVEPPAGPVTVDQPFPVTIRATAGGNPATFFQGTVDISIMRGMTQVETLTTGAFDGNGVRVENVVISSPGAHQISVVDLVGNRSNPTVVTVN